MIDITVDQTLHFHFPDEWAVVKYDDMAYYKNVLRCPISWKNLSDKKVVSDGFKGVDLIALDPLNNTLFLIECKDFRKYPRTKPLDLIEEFYGKVMHTLAGMLPAALNSDIKDTEACKLKFALHQVQKIRLIYHVEQQPTSVKLFPQAFDIAEMNIKVRSAMQKIDPQALVVDSSLLRNCVEWTVD